MGMSHGNPHVSTNTRNESFLTVEFLGGDECEENRNLRYRSIVKNISFIIINIIRNFLRHWERLCYFGDLLFPNEVFMDTCRNTSFPYAEVKRGSMLKMAK